MKVTLTICVNCNLYKPCHAGEKALRKRAVPLVKRPWARLSGRRSSEQALGGERLRRAAPDAPPSHVAARGPAPRSPTPKGEAAAQARSLLLCVRAFSCACCASTSKQAQRSLV